MTSLGTTAVRVVVRGHVQGVFFRDTCRRLARERGVVGWVRNRPDGTVEAVFDGERDAVRELVEWCRTGPPAAVVEDVHVTPTTPEQWATFEIR